MNERKTRAWLQRRLLHLVTTNPGRTALDMTRALYRPELLHSRLSVQLRSLLKEGKIRREGRGGKRDPYRYYPTATGSTRSEAT